VRFRAHFSYFAFGAIPFGSSFDRLAQRHARSGAHCARQPVKRFD
jgi:hypothetical protein